MLKLAGVYPHHLIEHDDKARRPWARFMRTFAPRPDDLPDSIDISHSGSETLAHQPNRPVPYYGSGLPR